MGVFDWLFNTPPQCPEWVPATCQVLQQAVARHQFGWNRRNRPAARVGSKTVRLDLLGLTRHKYHVTQRVNEVLERGQQLY